MQSLQLRAALQGRKQYHVLCVAQDAHEFLNYLLNQMSEVLEAAEKERGAKPPLNTWVHDIFQGKLVNETRCLQCETITSR